MASISRGNMHEFDYYMVALDECYSRGWTDGLPVVPPTDEKVGEMLDYVNLEANHILGEVPVRRRTLTAEQAAANAVMSGCLPEYFPVVLTVLDVLFKYDPNCIHEVFAVTNSTGILILLNGPIREQLDVNCTGNLFSYSNRANTTIGRAVRLILINVFEQRPGILDRGCMGSLTKNGVCIGEDQENSPWVPFHVSRGFSEEESTVTVATIQDPEMMGNRYGRTAECLMEATADVMGSHGLGIYFNSGPQWFWIVGHWHSEMFGRQGWSRSEMQKYVWERAWRSRAHLKRLGMINGDVAPEDDSLQVHAALRPEDIHIIKAGGNSGIYSELIMNYYGVYATTVPIKDSFKN